MLCEVFGDQAVISEFGSLALPSDVFILQIEVEPKRIRCDQAIHLIQCSPCVQWLAYYLAHIFSHSRAGSSYFSSYSRYFCDSAMTAVAERMNMSIFNGAAMGCAARLAGRCEFQPESQQWFLQTFDGGKLPVQNSTGMEIGANQVVEIVGTKGPQGQLCATTICKLPGDVDGELWNQAVQMAHHSKLRHLFQPLSAA